MTTLQLTSDQRELLDIIFDALPDPDQPGVASDWDIQRVLDQVGIGIANSSLSSTVSIDTDGGAVSIDTLQYMEKLLTDNATLVTEVSVDTGLTRTIDFYDGYSLILEFISTKGSDGYAEKDASGTYLNPLENVDEFTWVFLEGARATNLNANRYAGETAFGIMGVEYNDAQYELRYGEGLGGDTRTQAASNSIAFEIVATTVAEAVAGRTIPSLFHFGQADGQEGAADLWRGPSGTDLGPLGLGAEIGGWAGTPFFAMLNEPGFFERDILYYENDNPGSPDYVEQSFSRPTDRNSIVYQNTTTYDLLALTQSFVNAGFVSSGKLGWEQSVVEALDAINGASIVSGENANNILNVGIKANNFLKQSYGPITGLIDDFGNLIIGLDPMAGLASEALLGAVGDTAELALKGLEVGGKLTLGTNVNSDVEVLGAPGASGIFAASNENDLIHGGRGNELIYGGLGEDIIDGGANFTGRRDGENDTVSYENIGRELRFSLFDPTDLIGAGGNAVADSFVGSVTYGKWYHSLFAPELKDLLFGIETIIGTPQDDTFLLNRLTRDLTIDGGEGMDALSFEDYTTEFGRVELSFTGDENGFSDNIESFLEKLSLSNIEGLIGTRFGDKVELAGLEPLINDNPITIIDAFESLDRGDLLDVSQMTAAVDIELQFEEEDPDEPVMMMASMSNGPDGEEEYQTGRIISEEQTLQINNFDDVVATEFADTIIGSDTRNTIYAGDENDSIDGGLSHDDLYGGLGNDEILGGDGADYIYDNGTATPIGEEESLDAFVNRIIAYDPDGNDTIDAGAGSDVIFYSGGTDTIIGGAGNDLYITAAEVHGSYGTQDNLTIVLSEDVNDESSWFGNDLILGDGRGVDRVRLEGISSSDVTISYNYEEVFLGEEVAEFNPLFWWTFSFDPATYKFYQTIGSYEIRVNATGSSIVVEDVRGYHARGDNPSPLGGVEASMSVPFVVEFDDGLMSWPDNVLDSSNNFYTFENSELGDNAFAARDALQTERDMIEDEINAPPPVTTAASFASGGATGFSAFSSATASASEDGTNIFGNIGANLIYGNSGDDNIYAGAASDVLIGGAGADALFGGRGTDTASYATATSGVGIYLNSDGFIIVNDYGDGEGDTFDSIENIIGSDYADNLNGDENDNLIEGGAGNDTIRGLGGLDTLMGGAGDDEITAGEYVDENSFLYISDQDLYGGDGNDTIRSSSGNDFISGGDGDDLIELSNFVNIFSPGTPGNDTIDGGAGLDTVDFFNAVTFVDLGAGIGRYANSNEEFKLIDVEGVEATGADELIIGSDADNVLIGESGDDTMFGGAGNDDLYTDSYTFSGNAVLFGGSGIDTAHLIGFDFLFDDVTVALVDGALLVTGHGGDDTVTVHDDVEFLEFSQPFADPPVIRTFQELAGDLITEFALIDDFLRVEEAATVTLDFLANDLEFDGNPITIETVNGSTVIPGSIIRLDGGATVTVEADGNLTFDQGGAYAWLDANESRVVEFTYTATDFTNISKTAKMTLVVDGVDTASDQIHLENDVFIADTNPDAADALRIGNFNVNRTILIVDEEYIDPLDVPDGYSVEEINGDTFITYGSDDAIVLNDIALDTWEYVAGNRTLGTSASETINGTDGNDAIQAGGGNDRVIAGDGDDVVVGGDGNDDLEFSGGDNVALGGSGADTLDGFGSGANLFYGGIGNDRLLGGDNVDTLYGGSGDDLIRGYDGDDSLYGGDGDDTFYGGDGVDFFDGGEGFDELELQNEYPTSSSPGLFVNMRAGFFGWADGSYGNERFIDIEKIVGTSGTDYMVGNDVGVWLDGVGGDDTLIGGTGDDTLTDGYGNNELYAGDGDDYLSSSSLGNDLFDAGAGNDTMYSGGSYAGDPGHRGNDTFIGGEGIDNLRLAFGYGSTAIDLVAGTMQVGAYNSVISGVENVETGRGNDTILGDGADNELLGNDGNDSIVGADGNDTLDGEDGDDTHLGGAGDDLLIGNLGADYFDGGDGVDTIDWNYNDTDNVFDLSSGIIDFESGGQETIANIENVIAGGGDDTLIGNDDANRLDGGVGNDTYEYVIGGGNDVISDSDGSGTLDLSSLTSADVSFGDDGLGNLLINFSDGAVVTVEAQLSGGGLSGMIFSGETFDAAGIAQKLAVDTGSNVAPQSADDTATVAQNSSALIDVLANDSDPNGDALTIIGVTDPANGNAVIEGNQVRYTPGTDFIGSDTLTYTISDGNGGTNTATLNVTVSDTNRALVLDGTAGVDVEDLVLTGAFTIESWVNFTPGTTIGNVDGLVTDGDQSLNFFNGFFRLYAPGDVIIANTPAVTGEWMHFALTRDDSGNLSVYVDGQLDATGTYFGAVNVHQIGASRLGASEASFDEFRIWTVERSEAEIQSALNATVASDTAGLERQYTFDGIDASIVDATGNSADAAIPSGASLIASTSPVDDSGPTNVAPEAVTDTAVVEEDGTILIDVLANDTDSDGDTLVLTDVSGALKGTATVNSGQVEYTPEADFNGTETLSYTVIDGNGGTDTGTINVTVASVNDAPVATDDSATLLQDSSVLVEVLANDTDVDGDTLSISVVGTATNGVATIVGSQISYAPNPGFSGTDSVTYTATDGNGGESIGVAFFTVERTNVDPTAVDDTASVEEDGTVLVDVLANDSDGDDDPLTLDNVTGATNGTATLDNGQVNYTPNADFNGSETLTYAISDGMGGSDTASVTITVNAVNDVPVTADDSASLDEDGSILVDVLTNDTDVDGDTLTLTSIDGATNGTATVEAGQVRYMPDAGFFGTETLTYAATDGQGGSNTGTLTLTVNEVNDPPVAADDTATVEEDGFVLVDVTANDTDDNGDALTVVSVDTPANGSAVIGANQVRYDPNPNFNGVETITYMVEDGRGGSDTASIQITVNSVNDLPSAVDDSAILTEDSDILIAVLANDSDVDGGTLSILSVDGALNGTAVIESGQVRYTPDANYNGSEFLTYTLSDGQGGTDTASIQITIAAIEDGPVAQDDTATVEANGSVLIDALANDFDPEEDVFYISFVSATAANAVSIENGLIRYDPFTNYIGPAEITYTITTFDGQEDQATVFVSVVPENNSAPVAVDDTASVLEDGSVLIDAAQNDADSDGDPVTLIDVTGAVNGTAVLEGGQVRYTPNADFNGSETLSYTIIDGNGGTDTGTASITVTPVNDAPIAVDDNATLAQDTSVLVDVFANDIDVDGDTLLFSGFGFASNGSIGIDGTQILYTPNAGFSGTDSTTYTVTDNSGGEDTANVFFTVEPSNAVPIAVADAVSVDEGGTVLIDALLNDTDADGDTLTLTDVTGAVNGMAMLEGGQVRYTPDAGFSGSETLTYTISDGNGGSDTGTVSITVDEVNTVPVATDDTAVLVGNSALIDVLANDSDADGDALSITSVGTPSNGTAVIQGGSILYSVTSGPETLIDTGFEGDTGGFAYADDAFRSTSQPGFASGNSGAGVGQTGGGLSVTIGGINNTNITNGMSGGWNTTFTMATAGAATLDFSYRLDANIGYEPDEYSEVLVALDGALTGLSGNDYVTRIAGGGDSGWVTVSLDLGTLSAGQHELTLGGFNNKKTFNRESTTVSFDNVTLTTDAGSGTPAPDSFTYTIDDGNGGTSTATVSITLPVPNTAPVAAADAGIVAEDGSVLVDVLANDTDVDGDVLTLTDVSGATNGTATLEAGQVRYTPNADFNGTETLSYTIDDGNGGSGTGTVTMTVSPMNDAPEAAADTTSVNKDGTVLIDVLANDIDIDGDVLTLTEVAGAVNGAAIIEAGQIRYTPDTGFTGSETLSYTVSDGNGGSDTTTINLTVDSTPFAAIDDNAATTVGTPILIEVLANDTDGTGPYILVSVTDPANGSIEIQGNSVLYTPDTGGGQSTPVDAGFDINADQFVFADDLFRSTNQPGFASGGYQASGGQTGGSVEVVLGGLNNSNITNGMSGGWTRDFTVDTEGQATLSFAYDLDAALPYENDEFSQVLFALDGALIGTGGNDYIAQLAGGGATGWQTVVLDLGVLSAGTHTLDFGAYNNKKTFNNEITTVRFDDIDLSIASGMDFTGTDSFDYIASDTLGNQDIGTVFVDIDDPFGM